MGKALLSSFNLEPFAELFLTLGIASAHILVGLGGGMEIFL